jgi:hypothetical protein
MALTAASPRVRATWHFLLFPRFRPLQTSSAPGQVRWVAASDREFRLAYYSVMWKAGPRDRIPAVQKTLDATKLKGFRRRHTSLSRDPIQPPRWGGAIFLVTPGTSCLATIMLSLWDKTHSLRAEALIKLALMGFQPWAPSIQSGAPFGA